MQIQIDMYRYTDMQIPYILLSILEGGTEEFYFLIKEYLKLYTNNTNFFSFR